MRTQPTAPQVAMHNARNASHPNAARRRLQFVTRTLALGTLLLWHTMAPAASTDAARRATQDYCDLLCDLVFVAPSPLQQPMIDQAWALFSQSQAAPAAPDPALPAALLRNTAALYARVRRQHPAVLVAWNATGVQRGDGTNPFTFARGVPYVVLVEVSNAMACAGQFSVTAPGVTTASKAPVWIDAGEVRCLWLCVRVDSATAPALTLSIARIDQPAQRQLDIPLHLVAPALIKGTLRDDATGAAVPGRVYVRDGAGQMRYGLPHGTNDTFLNKPVLQFVFAGKAVSQTVPFFYADGQFEIAVPPGRTTVIMERGYEHLPVSTNVVLAPGAVGDVTLAPRRMIDMRARGWVSGDTHVHWAKNNWYENEAMPLLAMVQRAEDLRVINNLTLKQQIGENHPLSNPTGTHYFIAPTQFPMGPAPGYCDNDWHIQMGEEYRNEEYYGHINLLNITNIIEPLATGTINVPPHWDYPLNAGVFRATHAQGGIVTEAHGLGRNNDVPVNVIQGLSDALDQLEPDDYYRFLDCGVQIGLGNGSDHPARITGCVRTYVKSTEAGAASADQGGSGFHPAIAASGHGSPSHIQEKSRLYQGWIDGIRSNRTFTTSGPLLLLDVNGHDIGDVLNVGAATPLRITARALSRHPLGTVEIVSNGRVLAATNTRARTAELTLAMPAGESRWLVARCSPTNIFNVLYAPNAAHTSAIYINVDGKPRILPAAVQEWINRMTIHANDLEKNGRFQNDVQRQEAVAHVRAGIAAYQRLLPVSTSATIRLTPVPVTTPIMRQAGMRDGQDLNRVRFHVQAPWMSGPVELRFPEVLKSTWGYHYLDHYMAQIPPLHEWRAYPQWQKDEVSGRIWYDFTTPEGLRLIASATPVGDEVRLEFTIVNQATQSIAYVEPNCCLALNDCPELNDKHNISSLYAMLDGTFTALEKTTPTPAQMGRTPWLVMTRTTPKPALDSPMLWCIDQTVSDNLMAAVTRDRAHMLGYTWSVEPAYLMSNCGNPCLHTGMGSSPEIPPGKSFTWRGRMYCMTNDPAALVARYRRDQKQFRQQAQAEGSHVTLETRDAATGVSMPCRVHLYDAVGQAVQPPGLPFWYDHFACTGCVPLQLAAGEYTYAIERGPEYTSARGRFVVPAATPQTISVALRRLADLAAEGWWSGDLHVHRWLDVIGQLMQAEDLHVAPLTTWWNNHGPWATTPLPEKPLMQFGGDRFAYALAGEDERGGGALLYFNLPAPLPGFENMGRETPSAMTFMRAAKAQAPGTQAGGAPVWVDLEKPFWQDTPIWLASGLIDSVGIAYNHLQRDRVLDNEAWGRARDRAAYPPPWGNGLWAQDIYYHILNSGFRLPPSAGSASGVLPNPLGYNRVYVQLDGPLTYANWWAGLRAGRVFVGNGPLLRCRANGAWPGQVLRSDTPLRVVLEGRLDARDPIAAVELVQNGRVARITLPAEFTVPESGWFLVRAIAGVTNTFRFASTGPWYAEIGGQALPVRRASAQFFLDGVRARKAQLEQTLAGNPARDEVLQQVGDAEKFWEQKLTHAVSAPVMTGELVVAQTSAGVLMRTITR